MMLPPCCPWCCNPRNRKRSRVVLYFRMHPNARQTDAALILDVTRGNVSTWHNEAVRRGCVPRRVARKGAAGWPPAGVRALPIGALPPGVETRRAPRQQSPSHCT